MVNNKFFTNTYNISSGKQNYLRIDHLEDPLFASFTFDIDFVSSPLFYTINDYEYTNGSTTDGKIAVQIETALQKMYAENMGADQGYDILPMLSAYFLNGEKMGFGLQQNVYTDLPLYGATEYIYMVDKRNGDGSQNDVRYDNSNYPDGSNNPQAFKSYKLGDSVKEAVSESDRLWAEKKVEEAKAQKEECERIKNEKSGEHKKNVDDMNLLLGVCLDITEEVDGEKLNEAEILNRYNTYKQYIDNLEYFKKRLVNWANEILGGYKSRGNAIYGSNKCVQKICGYDTVDADNRNKIAEELSKKFETGGVENFRDEYIFGDGKRSYFKQFYELYKELESYGTGHTYTVNLNDKSYSVGADDGNSFLFDTVSSDGMSNIRSEKIIAEFRKELDEFGLLTKGFSGKDTINFKIFVAPCEAPDWAQDMFESRFTHFRPIGSDNATTIDNFIKWVMSYQCDLEYSFDESFTSEKIKENEQKLEKYDRALDEIRTALYGFENGKPCDGSNPSPDSKYGQYLAAKEKCENDDWSQADKALSLANSTIAQMGKISPKNEESTTDDNGDHVATNTQPSDNESKQPDTTPQTVLDMLGFISGMRKMTTQYPYIIHGISGLDKAYNTHYMIKDPYLGSGDDKITLNCWESLDLRVSSMFNRYFNAVYDRQYRRERVPINLRRFNCSIYVHDVRSFVSNLSSTCENRLLELKDMYYSVVEFRFYDCEIVPEETGNIFNDISNESPSDMKKTNFTFKYGNCVVNFVPQNIFNK